MRECQTAQLYQRYEGCFLDKQRKTSRDDNRVFGYFDYSKSYSKSNSAKRQFHLPEVRETMKERLTKF